MSGVLQVVHGWPGGAAGSVGGAERVASTLFHGLRELGVESWAYAADTTRRGDEAQVEKDPHVHLAPPPRRAARSFKETWWRPEVERDFEVWIHRTQPEVVHFHHLASLSPGLPRIAARSGALTVMTLHDYWLLCVRGQLLDREWRQCAGPEERRCARCVLAQLALGPISAPLASAWRAALARARACDGARNNGIISKHIAALGSQGRELLGRLKPRPERASAERIEAMLEALTWIQHLVSPSLDLARRVEALGWGRRGIEHLALPLDPPLEPAPPAPAGLLRLLFLGALFPSKGPHLLMEAFRRLPPGRAELTLAGPSPASDLWPEYQDHLRDLARSTQGITLRGAYLPSELPGLLHSADVLVIPSLWQENSPLVAREAAAAGLRVVAARRGGIAELIPEARFFEPLEPGALESALLAELDRGRHRNPPRQFPSRAEYAREMLLAYHRWGWHSGQALVDARHVSVDSSPQVGPPCGQPCS